jgi:hypothetical protein
MRLIHDDGAADGRRPEAPRQEPVADRPRSAEVARTQSAPTERPWPSPPGVIAHIYRPSRNVMQAGRANTRHWVLELQPRAAPEIEPLMGWTASRDPLQQVRLTFPDRGRAVAFAERQGWAPLVREPHERRFQPKRYADNFHRPPRAN